MSAKLLFPETNRLKDWLNPPLMPCYAEESVDCLNELSRLLLANPDIKRHQDLTALAFWLRAANLKKIAASKLSNPSSLLRPIGNVLHIAPANIDTLFFYSGALSLLTGNRNLIRLSRRRGESRTLILDALHQLYRQKEYRRILDRLFLFESDYDDNFLSQSWRNLDLRIVWGGNATIAAIRKIPISPHCRELTFPDKFSFALIGSNELINASETELNAFIQKFVNDAYLFGQQACSSPKALTWLGTKTDTELAQKRFWPSLANYLKTVRYPRSGSEQMQAFIGAQMAACQTQNIRINTDNPWFSRAEVENLNDKLRQCHHGDGLFYEKQIEDIVELTAQLTPEYQTLSYWGVDRNRLIEWLKSELPPGIDRIVPIGQSLNFDYIWDGVDLLDQMTRMTHFSG